MGQHLCSLVSGTSAICCCFVLLPICECGWNYKEKRRQPNAALHASQKRSNTPHNYSSRCAFTTPNIRCQLGFGFLSRAAVIQSGERWVITNSQLRSARVVTRFFVLFIGLESVGAEARYQRVGT